MEIIPATIHFYSLMCLVGFAVIRGSAFPLTLTIAYAAFFYITIPEDIELLHQILISATLTSVLCTFTLNFGYQAKHSAWFCVCMIIGIMNLMLMLIFSNFDGMTYFIGQVLTASITFYLHIAEFLILLGMIHGSGGDRVIKKLGRWCMASLSIFTPSLRAIPSHIWESRDQQR